MSARTLNPTWRQRSFLRRQFLPTWDERKRMLAPQAWITVVATYAAILFAHTVPQDFRDYRPAYVFATWVALVIRTFAFHWGLFLAAIALIAAFARRWRLLLAALPLVVVSIGPAFVSYLPRRRPGASSPTVTVMSVNLLYANRRTAPLIREIVTARPDVLLLQEYTACWHTELQAALGREYPYVRHAIRDDSFGLAVYSRTPLDSEVVLNLRLGNADEPQARAVAYIGGRRVALYNIHLLPPRNLGYCTEQRREFSDLLKILENESLPIVLSGDLNFVNESAFGDELRRLGLTDVHALSGYGRGATWPVLGLFRVVPGIRLDHIYVSRELTSPRAWTGIGEGSDHRPVIAEVGLAPRSLVRLAD
jgi:endonuclease/exonuclease/phosphatase (EEP) superfamily protein YafD